MVYLFFDVATKTVALRLAGDFSSLGCFFICMNLIYVDESGDDGFSSSGTYSPGQTPSPYFVRAGLIVHDKKWRSVSNAIGGFKYSKLIPMNVELHATEIASGRHKKHDPVSKKRRSIPNWYGLSFPNPPDRLTLLENCCQMISTLDICLVVVAIDKSKIRTTHPNHKDMPKENSWEFLLERANLFLTEAQDKKGMIISDAIENTLEAKHRTFAKALLAQSVHIKEFHFVESILFEPSDSSNLLQITDVVAWAYGRRFNSGDTRFSQYLDSKLLTRYGTHLGYGLKSWPD